jgi:diguanylate cyclase (GGDEF)-like protein
MRPPRAERLRRAARGVRLLALLAGLGSPPGGEADGATAPPGGEADGATAPSGGEADGATVTLPATSRLAHKCAASRRFDAAVVAAGAVVALWAFISSAVSGDLDRTWLLMALGGVPFIALMSRFPLVLTRGSAGLEVGFESAVLVFLACLYDGTGALAVWAVGQVVSQATSPKRARVRVFNVGLSTLAGAVALAAMSALSDLRDGSPRELLAVAVGCALYFVTDYLVSGVSIALEDGSSALAELTGNQGLTAGGVFVAIDSLGYLGALVVRGLPAWASLLLGVPITTILVATRALSRGAEHHRRLTALFDAAAALQAAQCRSAVLDVLRAQVRTVVVRAEAEVQAAPPTPAQVGASLPTADGDLWLVSPARDRARSSVEADRQALEALARVAQQALSRVRLSEQMTRQAREDDLTGLPNRVAFVERVEGLVGSGRCRPASVAVLYLDLDGFKSVNDRFGHAAGDELLRSVAERLRRQVREEDCVARLSGDEFAVLVEGADDVDRVEALCARLVQTLRAELQVAGHEVVVGASIGVAAWSPGDDAAALLRHADMAMYRAKTLGKNQYVWYAAALGEELIQRLELVEALRQGMDHELVVHYQPVIDLASGDVTGVEALVRWQRGGTLVPPDSFIAAAEESGLVVELGERVLAQVVRDCPALVAAVGRPLELAVNMSAHQLREPAFLHQVRGAVAALGDSRLVLEMTETVLVQDDAETAETLRQLTAAGARLAIDDFGVGFSSIGYLQHLPVALLKIDRSFTRDVDTVPRARALVDAILLMAQALDLDVVAEGIERADQVDLLRDAGCPAGQGYLFGAPQPLPEALRTLGAGAARATSAR